MTGHRVLRLLGIIALVWSLAACKGGTDEGSGAIQLPTQPLPGTDNRPPEITGQPATQITAGTSYLFQPSASDPDGDTLTFTIENAPRWAVFDSQTGALSGVPTMQDVGTTSGVTIRVSDGQSIQSLPPFEIRVNSSGSGSAFLTWMAPDTNEDGSVLSDLAGFKVRYGTAQGSYPNTIVIDDPTATSYLVENLSAGNYYFVTIAFDYSGNESELSNVATKAVQ